MNYYNMFETICPCCGESLEFSALDDTKDSPQQGDLCVCTFCSNILKYSNNKAIPVLESEMMILASNEPELFAKIKIMQSLFSTVFGRKIESNLN